MRVVFIGGSGRSGSTLIERLLGRLPGVCNVGEVAFLWERGLQRGELCGCGLALLECPFWCEVGKRAFGGWDSFNVDRFLALKESVDRNQFIPALAVPARGGEGKAEAPCAGVRAGLRQAVPGDPARQRVPSGRGLEQARIAGLLPARM